MSDAPDFLDTPIFFKTQSPFKTMLLVSIVSILILSMTPGVSSAKNFFDYNGLSTFYGTSDGTNIGPDPSDGYDWAVLNYILGKHINPYLSFETHMGAGYLQTDNFDDSASAELRLLLDLHYGWFFLKFGGGLSHVFDSGNLPDLAANEDYYSIASGSVGIRVRFDENGKMPDEMSIGYAVEHLSAPFKGGEDGDNGWNAGGIQFNLNWRF